VQSQERKWPGSAFAVGSPALQQHRCHPWRLKLHTFSAAPPSLTASHPDPFVPQVYAANRYSSSPKGRWLARGVDILLHSYPSLRVAFIDSFQGEQVRWACGAHSRYSRCLQ